MPASLTRVEKFCGYRDFFALFEDFRRYVEFFMLQDLVTDDCCAVRFFMPFDDFNTSSVPRDGDAYKEYRHLSIESSRLETAGLANTLLLEACIAELAAPQIVRVLSFETIRNGADARRFPPWRWHMGVEKAESATRLNS